MKNLYFLYQKPNGEYDSDFIAEDKPVLKRLKANEESRGILGNVDYTIAEKDCFGQGVYLNDILTVNRCRRWLPGTDVFINAQTGCGKTTWVREDIRKIARERKQAVLYVANRTCIVDKVMMLLAREKYTNQFKSGKSISDDALMILSDYAGLNSSGIGGLYIESYQGLAKMLEHRERNWPENIGFIVLDEVHFFTSDALFNTSTEALFDILFAKIDDDYIFSSKQLPIRISLTATDDNIIDVWFEQMLDAHPDLLEKYQKLEQITTHFYTCDGIGSQKIKLSDQGSWLEEKFRGDNNEEAAANEIEAFYYRFEPKYDYVNMEFFEDDRTIVDLISKSQEKEKFFVDVDSKEFGADLQNKLKDAEIDAEFISAENKDDKGGELYRKMLQNEKFEAKVLISTPVLDVGIDFWDNDLQNIVIYSTDAVVAKQMIGRKRVKNRETKEAVNVYFKVYDADTLRSRKQKCNEKIKILKDDRNKARRFNQNFSSNSFLFDLSSQYVLETTKKGHKILSINNLSIRQLECQDAQLEEFLKCKSNDEYADIIYRWFDLEAPEEILMLDTIDKEVGEELEEFLKAYCDRELSKDEFLRFRYEFMQYISKHRSFFARKTKEKIKIKIPPTFEEWREHSKEEKYSAMQQKTIIEYCKAAGIECEVDTTSVKNKWIISYKRGEENV